MRGIPINAGKIEAFLSTMGRTEIRGGGKFEHVAHLFPTNFHMTNAIETIGGC
jgi:hypothetical protein